MVLVLTLNSMIEEFSEKTILLMQLHYSREDEYQADDLGVKYSYKSGYDPSGMISFFKKLETLTKLLGNFINPVTVI